MTNKIALTVGAAVVGGAAATAVMLGTTAGAAPSTTPSAPTSGSTTAPAKPGAKHAGKHAGKDHHGSLRLRNVQHGTWVTKSGKSGNTFITHSVVQGAVNAVSATSITVKAGDGYAATFVVTKDTKVRIWTNGKPASSTIGAVKPGLHVAVVGVGTPKATAEHIVIGTRK